MKQLKSKSAVVTGAASGIGLAFAKRFAAAGMNVMMADIEPGALRQAAEQLQGSGSNIAYTDIDVSDAEQVQQLAADSIEMFGQVNVVCNNAGVSGSSLTAGPGQLDLNDWAWVLNVNLWGVIHGHQAFLPHLLEHGDGHIVNTASMAGHLPGHSAYMASKWAVVGITEGLYHQLNDMGSSIGVSCLCPGWVQTKIAESDRNRPEWAAPSSLVEPSSDDDARDAVIKDLLASGMQPDQVADLVHDAIVDNQFWIFTDNTMVEQLSGRFDAIRDHRNPERVII